MHKEINNRSKVNPLKGLCLKSKKKKSRKISTGFKISAQGGQD